MEETKFSKIAQEWLKIKKLSIKASTYVKYRINIENHLNDLFVDKDIDEWNDIDYYDLFEKLLDEGEFSRSTIKAFRTILKSILQYGEEEYGLKHINLSRIKLHRDQQHVKVLTNEEAIRLSNYCEKNINYKTVPAYIALYTGLRIGEVCGLKWEDIDLKNNEINVNRAAHRITNYNDVNKSSSTILTLDLPKTKTSARKVIMPDYLSKYLATYKKMNQGKESSFVITNSDTIPEPRTVERRFERICHLLDIDLKFHELRHTYATNCLKYDMDTKTVSQQLGHSDISTTLDLYVHPDYSHIKKQVKKFKKFE